jgi:hypothetical protein
MHIRSNAARAGRIAALGKDLSDCHTLVFDITSLASVYLIGISEFVRQWRGKLVISQHTALELRKTEQELAHLLKGPTYFSKDRRGYIIQKLSIDYTTAQHEAFVAFYRFVASTFEVRSCLPLARMDPMERERLELMFSRHGVESIFLAKEAGHALMTEDLPLALVAEHDYSVRRAWIQAFLIHLKEIGIATEGDCSTVAAKLLGFDFRVTEYNELVLKKAGDIAQWDLDAWPLKKAVELHIAHTEDRLFVRLSAQLIKELYYNSQGIFERPVKIASFLERLAAAPRRFPQLVNLPQMVEQAFGLDAIPGRTAGDIVEAWLIQAIR